MKIEIEFELSENELAYFSDNDKERLTRFVTRIAETLAKEMSQEAIREELDKLDYLHPVRPVAENVLPFGR